MADTIPTSMKAIEIRNPGENNTLELVDRALPQPKEGEVLVKVAATSVNRLDLFQRLGTYPVPPGASDVLGLDIAGTVARRGSGVSEWNVGDKVCALVTGGGYAEYCTAAADNCLPVPKGLDMSQAAALPETFFTVWSNVFDRVGLKPGESFLVHGGSSGIGTTAIQLGANLGNRVFTTAGTAEKCKICEQLGAERAINYNEENFVEVIKAATDGEGINVILDYIAGDYVGRNLQALAVDGRVVNIATLGGATAEFNYALVMVKRLTLTGSTLRARSVEFKKEIADALRLNAWPLIEAGKITPVIHARYPLANAADAHDVMQASTHIGKLILEM